MGLRQKERTVAVLTDLGEDALLFRRMTATEEMSRCFEYQVDLRSEDRAVASDDLLGKHVAIRLRLKDKDERFFNGIVTRFAQVGTEGRLARYEMTLRPWLWLLTRTADCKIFQQQTVPEILEDVFKKHGFTDFEVKLTGDYPTLDYCVQYRETDFNFVSRLMEQEGIYYYFKHEKDKHILVLCDDYTAHEAFPGYEEIPLATSKDDSPTEQDRFFDWSVEREIQPGAYALNDFDFEKPRADLQVRSTVSRPHRAAEFEVYDYPGVYTESKNGDHYVRRRIEELQSQYELSSGSCNARGMTAGYLFTLTESPIEAQNREYLVLTATHSLTSNLYESGGSGETEYSSTIVALDSRTPFRPARITPKPLIRGPQTATVVGKSGEDIWTDPYARVKLQFPWDRYGKSDESSSCWVRVATVWAGTNWGGIHIPRIGQEVVVEHLEGDPDRPIVTGRVYNADCMPPYDLPANQTQSGLKSRSSKEGTGDNYNEIRFEDKKGEELLTVHAERNRSITVENDDTESVGNNQTVSVGNDRTETVGANETISVGEDRTETVGANEDVTIGVNQSEKVGADKTVDVGANMSTTIAASKNETVGSAKKVDVGGSLTQSVGSAKTETVGMMSNEMVGGAKTTSVGGAYALTVAGAMNTAVGLVQAEEVGLTKKVIVGKEIEIVCGDSTLKMDSGGKVKISGTSLELDFPSGPVKVVGDVIDLN